MEAVNGSRCLKVTVLTYQPFLMVLGRAPHWRFVGMLTIVLDILAQHLGFCFEYLVPNDSMFGDLLDNGTLTGQVALLNRSEADLSGLLSITSGRVGVVDFSEPLFVDEFIIAHLRPVIGSDMAGFVKPFNPWMWALVFLSIIAIFVAIFLTLWRHCTFIPLTRGPVVEDTDGDFMWYAERSFMWTVAILLCQSLPNEPKSVSVRVVVGLWLLVSFILGSVYRSNLKAMLILPKIVLPFDNLAELRDSQIPLFVTESTHIHRAIVEANVNTSLAQVRGQTYWHVDQFKAIADLYAGRHATAAIGASAKSVIHSYFSKTGHCNVYVMSGDVLPGISQSLAFPKGSTLKPKVDNVIRRLKESGILDYLFLKSVFNSTECLKPFNTAAVTSSDLRSLDLGDFYGVFSLYAAGIVVAGLTFVLEKLLGRGRQ